MPTRGSPTAGTKPPALSELREVVLPITRAHRIRHVRVFGSYARGDQRRRSDLDLFVRMPPGSSLFALGRLQVELEEALERKVDLIPDDSIKPALRARILSEAKPL